MTERPRIAQREPRSLQPEQLGQLAVSRPAVPQSVHAWILWEDGVEELMQGHAVAWTKRLYIYTQRAVVVKSVKRHTQAHATRR